MSTRSRIGFRAGPDLPIYSVYCHNDGYLSGVGRTLHLNYTALDQVQALVTLGELSSLGSTSARGDTTAYHRDRHEDPNKPLLSPDVEHLVAIDSNHEFVYLFDVDKWFVWETGFSDTGHYIRQDLTVALVTERITS